MMDVETSMTDAAPTQTSAPPAAAPDKPETPSQVTAFVEMWVKRIKAVRDSKRVKAAFKQMDESMQLAKDGASKAWIASDSNYTVPVLNRLTNQSVAQLYAKNPKAYAKRKQRRMFTVWDGTLASLSEAKNTLAMGQQTGMPPDPNAVAIIEDAEHVKQYDILMDGVAETLTILNNHFMQDPATQYKQQFKALVRRTKVCGVGYVKLSFQRILDGNPDVQAKLADATEKLAITRRLMSEAAEDELPEDSADAEQLKLLVTQLTDEATLIVQEGPVYSFPKSKSVIIDDACHHLKTLAGAGWVAEEFEKTPDEVQEIWGVDIEGEFTPHTASDDARERWSEKTGSMTKSSTAHLWRVMNRKTGQEFTICEGYKDYISPPAAPAVKLTRFFDIFPLVFNEIESDDDLYPPSDVWNARHLAAEYNRSRQGLREHRLANRPGYVAGQGTFEDADLNKFENHATAAIITINRALVQGEKIGDLLQAKPVMQIDPKQYEVDGIWQDILRVTGQQQANAGPTADATATESSIAENSRQIGVSDSADDIDDLLSQLAQATGQVMLTEMSKETVMEIVGPGAVWPEQQQTREEIAESISLDVRAGSSGRPNQAADLQKMQTAMPFVLQLPGVNPIPFTQKFLDLLEIDAEDAVVEGLPSMTALNAAMSKPPQGAPGDPANAPGAQGPQGANNAPKPPGTPPTAAPTVVHYDHSGKPIP